MGNFRGQVQVNNKNLGQGSFPEIERTLLYVGFSSKNIGDVLPVNNASDFDDLLGDADSDLKTNIEAAVANAGQNWQAFILPLAAATTTQGIIDAVDDAMATCSPEMIVVTIPQNDTNDIEAFHASAMLILGKLGRQVAYLLAVEGIDAETETWSDYFTRQEDLIDSIAGERVAVIPQLHGNDLGVLAGRLCNRLVSIADSPMRVATGAVVGLGETPVDKDGKALGEDTLIALSNVRFSTIQHYADYPGTYWADCPMLDVPTGDFKVIENLRVVMKVARNTRLLAIFKIGNRELNSTEASIESNKMYFARPMREMSKSTEAFGIVFPGECKPPEDGDVVITWKTKTDVEIFLKVCPYNSPKKITANIALDLTTI